jgi:AraC family transcriptional regulator
LSHYLRCVQRGVDFIETRLDEDVELAAVARAAGLSQWHFQRIFKALTGETLKAYIRSRRLASSLDRLLTTKLRVLDIAILAGFESQEAFARAFKAAFGISPLQYRELGKRSLFLKKPQFDADYLEHIHRNVTLVPEIQHQPRMRLVGMRTLFFGVDSEKNNIAERLPQLWEAFLPRMAEIPSRVAGVAYGVVRQEREDDERLEYHAASAVTGGPVVPEGMVALEVPEARYAKFAHRGPAQAIDHTVSYVYSTWLAQSGWRHTYGPDLEIYGPEYHPTSDQSVINYAIPIAPDGDS